MEDPTTTATLLALALAVVKILETLVGWVFKKMTRNGADHLTTVVELGPDATRMIRETHERVTDVQDIVSRTNSDGVPLVYGPRQEVHQLTAAVEDLGDRVEEITEEKKKR